MLAAGSVKETYVPKGLSEVLGTELQTGLRRKLGSFDHFKEASDVISLEITSVNCLST